MLKKIQLEKIVPNFVEIRQTPRNGDCHLISNPLDDDEIFMIPKHATLKKDKIYVYNTKKMQMDGLKITAGKIFVSLCKDVLQHSYLANKYNIKFPNTQHQSRQTRSRRNHKRKQKQRKLQHDTNDMTRWQISTFAVGTVGDGYNHDDDHDQCESKAIKIWLIANLCYNCDDNCSTIIKEYNMWILFDVSQRQFKLIQPNEIDHCGPSLSSHYHSKLLWRQRGASIVGNKWLFILLGASFSFCEIIVFKLNIDHDDCNFYPIHGKTLYIFEEYQYTNQGFVVRNVNGNLVELILFGGYRKQESVDDRNRRSKKRTDLCREIIQMSVFLPNVEIISISKIEIPCFCSQVSYTI